MTNMLGALRPKVGSIAIDGTNYFALLPLPVWRAFVAMSPMPRWLRGRISGDIREQTAPEQHENSSNWGRSRVTSLASPGSSGLDGLSCDKRACERFGECLALGRSDRSSGGCSGGLY